MSSIIVKGLIKSYGSVKAVKSVSLSIDDGAFFFLLGPSGCGKSTLLRLIAGLENPDSGELFFDAQSALRLSPQERNIGMVFQSYALWPHMTVAENIEFGLEVRKLPRAERAEAVGRALDIVRMRELYARYPSELSGGQQQRVALARALALSPRVILLDEPLSNLDTKLRLELRRELHRIHEETHVTMVYVTHDQGEALSLGTTIAVMKDGEILQVGSPRTLLQAPADDFVKRFLAGASLVHGKLIEAREGLVSVETQSTELSLSGETSLAPGSDVVLSVQASLITG